MAEITAQRKGELLAGVFQVLQKYPNGLAAADVLRQVSEIVPPTPFESSEDPNRPGVRRYEKIIRFGTVPFVKAGWLIKTEGMWIATDDGLAAFNKAGSDVESWFRDAVAKHRAWRACRERVLKQRAECCAVCGSPNHRADRCKMRSITA